ncbi:conserved hypothetical protein [Frankia sp. AiPs1]|uniref:hypothetical protein n=1 Tax=Frankia sp. AiPa1 TaxID=573492 RepID=UPI00202B28EB|nr:hypothetical protein [Frankia sp. AiPa1]MCL9760252.1 hypothetical protein [Frankia sp. AiPa1]
MKPLHPGYCAALAREWPGWWVTWPLLRPVALGDAFLAGPQTLVRAGALPAHGIDPGAIRSSRRSDFLFDADGNISLRFKAAGTAVEGSTLSVGDAGARVSFSRGNSALVSFTDLSLQEYLDAPAVARALAARYWAGSWEIGQVAVTAVTTARRAAVLLAHDGQAEAEVRLSAKPGAGGLTLAGLSGGIDATDRRNMALIWSGRMVTPVFQVVGLRRRWRERIDQVYDPRQPGGFGAHPRPVPELVLADATAEPFEVIEELGADQPPAWDCDTAT